MADVSEVTIDSIRAGISPEGRQLLDTAWQYYLDQGNWIPTKVLHHKYGSPKRTREIFKSLNGSLLCEANYSTNPAYWVMPLGVLCTLKGSVLLSNLVRFLEMIRDRFRDDPYLVEINEVEGSQVLGLDADESKALGKLIVMKNAFNRGANWSTHWTVYVGSLGDELQDVDSLDEYVFRNFLMEYDANLPIFEQERNIYVYNRSLREHEEHIRSEGGKFKTEFDFITDRFLAELLANDWRETQETLKGHAWKATVLLCGGILEGMLFSQLTSKCDLKSVRAAYASIPNARKKMPGLHVLALNELILVAENLLILKKGSGLINLGQTVRDFRNLIHPGKQWNQKIVVSEEHARVAVSAVQMFLREQ